MSDHLLLIATNPRTTNRTRREISETEFHREPKPDPSTIATLSIELRSRLGLALRRLADRLEPAPTPHLGSP